MSKDKTLIGFKNVQLFPVTANTRKEYTVGTAIAVEGVQSMTRDNITSEKSIYADDKLYLKLSNWSGVNVALTITAMDLKMISDLGFGTYDTAKKELKLNPMGENKQFAMSFSVKQSGGESRMYQFFCFTVSEIKESEFKTKGESGDVQTIQILGTFTTREIDDELGIAKDDFNLSWLDKIIVPVKNVDGQLNTVGKTSKSAEIGG